MTTITSHVNTYLRLQIYRALGEMDRYCLNKTAHQLATAISETHEKKIFRTFQQYYFQTLENQEAFLGNPAFFSGFKYQYGIQGVDTAYLQKLEGAKADMLELINAREIGQLYQDYFSQQKIQHGEGEKIAKDLGSFCAKFVHTFLPHDYCPLDNPIREKLGVAKESFFISFLILSQAYQEWAANHQSLLQEVRSLLAQDSSLSVIDHAKLTDIKLLDMIFWGQWSTNPKLASTA